MAATFTTGDIIHIEHVLRPNSNIIHDVGWPAQDRQATRVWQNGKPVGQSDLRRIETTTDGITLTTYAQRVTARHSGESQPGMVVGEVTAIAPAALAPTN